MGTLMLISCLVLAFWLIKKDTARRHGISWALWIPTLWVGILCSRPVSVWLGKTPTEGTDPSYSLEGSPIDRYFFLGLIVAAIYTLSRRRLQWQRMFVRNWPVFLFYGYLLLTTYWADSTMVSLKRWIKEAGNIIMILVILTEADPLQACRAAFARVAYLLFPLSIVFIRYFPDLGRYYNLHSGQIQAIGVTLQKNSLGGMVLVCSIVLIWDWIQSGPLEHGRAGSGNYRNKSPGGRASWFSSGTDRFLSPLLLVMGIWLLRISDSKTSIACLALGATILGAARLPAFRRRIGAAGAYLLIAILGYYTLDSIFDITPWLVAAMGRDLTFTGRTDVWKELLALHTNPVFGTGFCSFWSDPDYRAALPPWVEFSAHNGYLELFLDGGVIAVILLAILLLVTGLRINHQLAATESTYALVRFAILLVVIIASFSESNFARMTPQGFALLLIAIEVHGTRRRPNIVATVPPLRDRRNQYLIGDHAAI